MDLSLDIPGMGYEFNIAMVFSMALIEIDGAHRS